MRNYLIIDGFQKQKLSYKNKLNISEFLLIIAYELKLLGNKVEYFNYKHHNLEDLEIYISEVDYIIVTSDANDILCSFRNVSNIIIISSNKDYYIEDRNILYINNKEKVSTNIENIIRYLIGYNDYIFIFTLDYWKLLGDISDKTVEISLLDEMEDVLSEFEFLVQSKVKSIILSPNKSIFNIELIKQIVNLSRILSKKYDFIWVLKDIGKDLYFDLLNYKLDSCSLGQVCICTDCIEERLYKLIHKFIQHDNIFSIKIIINLNIDNIKILSDTDYILDSYYECIEFELEYDKSNIDKESLIIYQDFYNSVVNRLLKYKDITTSLYHIELYKHNILTPYYTYFVSKTSLKSLSIYIENGWEIFNSINRENLKDFQVKLLGNIYNSNGKKYIICDPRLFSIPYIEISYIQYTVFTFLKSNRIISKIEEDFYKLYPDILKKNTNFVYDFLSLLNKYNLVIFKRGLTWKK